MIGWVCIKAVEILKNGIIVAIHVTSPDKKGFKNKLRNFLYCIKAVEILYLRLKAKAK